MTTTDQNKRRRKTVRGSFDISVPYWMLSALSAAPAHPMRSLNASP